MANPIHLVHVPSQTSTERTGSSPIAGVSAELPRSFGGGWSERGGKKRRYTSTRERSCAPAEKRKSGIGGGGGKMVVRIRLSRFGCKNKPCYRVMAADSRSPRDGKHLEVLGYYNPLPGQDGGKRMGLNFDRVKYWLSVGAQPSEPVQRILFRAGVLPPPPMLAMTRKGGPRDTRPVDPLSGRYLTPESPEAAADQSECGENEAGEDGDKPNP